MFFTAALAPFMRTDSKHMTVQEITLPNEELSPPKAVTQRSIPRLSRRHLAMLIPLTATVAALLEHRLLPDRQESISLHLYPRLLAWCIAIEAVIMLLQWIWPVICRAVPTEIGPVKM